MSANASAFMRSRAVVVVLLGFTCLTIGCSTVRVPSGRRRIMAGAFTGAAVGAGSGAVLSPNDESRGLNALVFGLAGSLIGGAVAVLTDNSTSSEGANMVRDNERTVDQSVREFQVVPNEPLPSFLKNRVQPLIIEEYLEADTVSEDGTLHEPHKAYRIKRQGELFSRPVQAQPSVSNSPVFRGEKSQ